MCEKWKPESDFHKDRARTDRLKIRCKKCDTAYQRKIRKKKPKKTRKYLRFEERHRTFQGKEQKLCSRCNRWKNEKSFYRSRDTRDGLDSLCRACRIISNGSIPKKARKNLRYEDCHRTVNGVREKLCRKCRRWKKESDFYNNRSIKDGLDGLCKGCKYKPTKKGFDK